KSGTLNVTVTVLDSNDNPPVFSQEVYSATTPENVEFGTIVLKVNATDEDEGMNGEVEYFFGSELDQKMYDTFKLDKVTGEIQITGHVDFENAEVYKLDVHASDKGQPPMSTDCMVIIKVLDVNDNKPDIEITSLSGVVSEGSKPGAVVSLISITDKDAGDNGRVICSLSENVPFELKPSFQDNMYSLVTKQRLDRESVSDYEITITATDCGQPALSTFKTLHIQVSDVNDNRPEFPHDPVEVYLFENNVAGSSIFFEVSDHSLFGLDRYTGQIRTLRSFTETDEAQHKLVILVKDNGNVSLSATATVVVKLVEPKEAISAADVKTVTSNDNDTNITFYLMITLGTVSTLFLISIIVLIAMQCSKTTDVSAKYLPETNYDGTLCHSIQYRSGEKRYMLVGPRMILFYFGELVSAQIRYSTPEEVKVGSVIGNVAKDLGLDPTTLTERRFRIVAGPKDSLFEVNQNNGAVFVSKHIDREDICDHSGACVVELKIVVENPLEIHYISVEVTDRNDNAPIFPEREKVIEIAENTQQGARFQLAGAHDPDVGINSVQRYLLTQNDHFQLEIRDRGEDKIPFLVLQRQLDREQITNYSLVLTAVDGGKPLRSANLNVTILVLDINDNRPIFSQEVYSVNLRENIDIGTIVIKVQAHDLDEGVNGQVEYGFGSDSTAKILELFSLDEITGEVREVSDHSLFGLDRYTGQIRTLRSFTETDEAQHKLVILVKDNGNVSLSATATVVVKVVEPKEAISAADVKSAATDIGDSGVTFYLMITLASVSTLFLISIIVLIAMQCSKTTDVSAKYLPETNYDGTLCHSIQYRSGEKRY
ncbi:hypothetical protein CRUP_003330, partial [Coryphaenoides rupestris]